MTIEIRQCCNSCGLIRVIPVEFKNRFNTVTNAGNSDGWREVEDNKHLCNHCIKRAIHYNNPSTAETIRDIKHAIHKKES